MSAGAELSRLLGKNGLTPRPLGCALLAAVTYMDARARRGLIPPGLGSHDMRDSGRSAFVISIKMHKKRSQRERLQQLPVARVGSTRLSSLQFCHDIDQSTAGVMPATAYPDGVTARSRNRSPHSREHMPAIALDRHYHFLDRAAFG